MTGDTPTNGIRPQFHPGGVPWGGSYSAVTMHVRPPRPVGGWDDVAACGVHGSMYACIFMRYMYRKPSVQASFEGFQCPAYPAAAGLSRGSFGENYVKSTMSDQYFPKWHLVDKSALSHMQQFSTSPGINQLGTTAMPVQLQGIPSAVSYLVSAYAAPIPIGSNTIASSEMVIVRNDGGTLKAYNFALASSGDGRVYFNGPHKDFPSHHFSSSSQVPIESLFGNTPVSTKGSV